MSGPVVRAFETQFEFSGARGHAVVVEFGKAWRFVFWDKAQYVGCVDLGNGVMFTPEWCEVNSPNDEECYEPIMDKRLRWSSVEILESGPARARIKWRYALNDMRYKVFHGNTTAEEIYTIYPDGVAVREVVLWPGTASNHGGNANFWQVEEYIIINAAGTKPTDCIRAPEALMLRSGEGESVNVSWPLPAVPGPICDHFPQLAGWSNYIGTVGLRGTPSPFTIIPKSQALFPYIRCAKCGKDHPFMKVFGRQEGDPIYSHWPGTEREDFILGSLALDQVGKITTHTCFMNCNYAWRTSDDDFVPTPFPGTTWYMLVGAVPEKSDPAELDRLTMSWRRPAAVTIVRPAEKGDPRRGRVIFEGFDYSLRAYAFRQHDEEDRVEFSLDPTVPAVNPAFRLMNWTSAPEDIRVKVNGTDVSPGAYAAQISGRDLVVWIDGTWSSRTSVGFYGK